MHIKKNSITAGIIIHNEESTLERSLKSLKGVVDEIIVIHDGPCSDRSVTIAKKYSDKVFVRKRIGCCEGHYDFFKLKANSNWLLLIDGDEYLSKELANNLSKIVSNENVSAYEVYWPTFYKEKQLRLGLDRKLYKKILFKKSKIKFELFPHGQRIVDGQILSIDMPLMHKPKEDIFSNEYLNKKLSWAPVTARMILSKKKIKYPGLYAIKAVIWGILYFFYTFFLRMYFVSGITGMRYSIFYSKYNFMINWNIYKLSMDSRR